MNLQKIEEILLKRKKNREKRMLIYMFLILFFFFMKPLCSEFSLNNETVNHKVLELKKQEENTGNKIPLEIIRPSFPRLKGPQNSWLDSLLIVMQKRSQNVSHCFQSGDAHTDIRWNFQVDKKGRITSHLEFLENLENPIGFKQCLEEVLSSKVLPPPIGFQNQNYQILLSI